MTSTKILFCFLLLSTPQISSAQTPVFTKDDTLRGSITDQRAWWDLTFYHLKVNIDPAKRSIAGSNEIRYTVLIPGNIMQIDLQPPLRLEKAEQDGQALSITQQGRNA